MSVYPNRVKTHYLTSKFDKNLLRTEFTLPENSNFVSNFRLVDFGVKSSNNADRANITNGVMGMIDEIELMSGNKTISKITDFNSWFNWVITNYDNETNYGVNMHLTQGRLGFGTQDEKVCVNEEAPMTDFTHTGILNLSLVLGFLQAVEAVSSVKLPKLKVVVRYNRDLYKLFSSTLTTTNTYERFDDLNLAVDMIEGNIQLKDVVEYNEIECERFYVDAMTSDTQQINNRLRMFNGKFLNKILVKKEIIDPSTNDYAPSRSGSNALKNEQFQLVLNGSELLPYGGFKNQPNEMLGYLNQAWGVSTMIPTGNYLHVLNQSQQTIEDFQIDDRGLEKLIGNQSYIGLNVMDTVKDLQIHMSRDRRVADVPFGGYDTNERMRVLVFGEVLKVVDMSSGVVAYV